MLPSSPLPEGDKMHASTVTQRKLPIRLVAALDSTGEAVGQFYYDDGDSLDTLDFQEYTLLSFQVKEGKFTSTPVVTGFLGVTLRDVQVWGVSQKPSKVSFTKAEEAEVVLTDQQYSFNQENRVLTVTPLDKDHLLDLTTKFSISWS